MHLSSLDLLFWAAGLLGHVVLLVVLLRRRRAASFPIFTAFIAGSIIRTAVLYLTFHYGTAQIYSFTYWSMAILDVAVQLAVVYEIAAHVFCPLGDWARGTRRSFLWILCGSITTAAVLSWLAAPVTSTWQELLVAKGSFFTSALMSELFVCMTALAVSVRLPWKTHVARISQGLGIYSILNIVIEAGHTLYGAAYSTGVDITLSRARMEAYLACLAYWIVTLWQNAPKSDGLSDELHQQLLTLQRYVAVNLQIVRGRGEQ